MSAKWKIWEILQASCTGFGHFIFHSSKSICLIINGLNCHPGFVWSCEGHWWYLNQFPTLIIMIVTIFEALEHIWPFMLGIFGWRNHILWVQILIIWMALFSPNISALSLIKRQGSHVLKHLYVLVNVSITSTLCHTLPKESQPQSRIS